MSESGFLKEVYSESGESSIVFTPADIYNSTEEYYYVDKSDSGPFKSGDWMRLAPRMWPRRCSATTSR